MDRTCKKRNSFLAININQRDISGSFRVSGNKPEIVIYDSTPGGAGYCDLIHKQNIKDILQHAIKKLTCKRECTNSCRSSLCSYENQNIWDKLNRKPVLKWIEEILSYES